MRQPMTSLELVGGRPWKKQLVVKDGKNIWTALNQFEVRAQLRANENTDSLLISNQHLFMTSAFSGNDIVIAWTMSGAQTKSLYNQRWGNNKIGYVSIILSDVGASDVKAIVIPTFQIKAYDTTTAISGVT